MDDEFESSISSKYDGQNGDDVVLPHHRGRKRPRNENEEESAGAVLYDAGQEGRDAAVALLTGLDRTDLVRLIGFIGVSDLIPDMASAGSSALVVAMMARVSCTTIGSSLAAYVRHLKNPNSIVDLAGEDDEHAVRSSAHGLEAALHTGAGAGASSAVPAPQRNVVIHALLSVLDGEDLVHIFEYLGGIAMDAHIDRDILQAALTSSFGYEAIVTATAAYVRHLNSLDVIDLVDDSDVDGEIVVEDVTEEQDVRLSRSRQGASTDLYSSTSSVLRRGSRGLSNQVITISDDEGGVMSQGEKIPAESPQYSSISRGASSSSAPVQPPAAVTFRAGKGDCLICYDDTELFRVGLCEHALCPTCCVRTIRSQLSRAGAVSLPCPYCAEGGTKAGAGGAGKAAAPAVENITGTGYFSELCVAAVFKWSNRPRGTDASQSTVVREFEHAGEALPEDDLPEEERPLSKDERDRIDDMVATHALSVAGCKMIKCPNLKCGERMASESTSASKQACPSCNTRLCGSCGVDWDVAAHGGRSCEDVQGSMSAEQDASELSKGDMAGTFKRCPVCGMGCEHRRGHGCHHMTCMEPSCRAHWCWVCCGPFPCARGCPGWCNDECDCIACTDCGQNKAVPGKKGAGHQSNDRSCSTCSGPPACQVCAGNPETEMLVKKRAAAVAKKVATGWIGPRSTPPEGLTKDSYNSLRQKGGRASAGAGPFGAGFGFNFRANLADFARMMGIDDEEGEEEEEDDDEEGRGGIHRVAMAMFARARRGFGMDAHTHARRRDVGAARRALEASRERAASGTAVHRAPPPPAGAGAGPARMPVPRGPAVQAAWGDDFIVRRPRPAQSHRALTVAAPAAAAPWGDDLVRGRPGGGGGKKR